MIVTLAVTVIVKVNAPDKQQWLNPDFDVESVNVPKFFTDKVKEALPNADIADTKIVNAEHS